MDQEAEIMKQSMARQEAAQEAAADEQEPGRPLRSVSSGARGDVYDLDVPSLHFCKLLVVGVAKLTTCWKTKKDGSCI